MHIRLLVSLFPRLKPAALAIACAISEKWGMDLQATRRLRSGAAHFVGIGPDFGAPHPPRHRPTTTMIFVQKPWHRMAERPPLAAFGGRPSASVKASASAKAGKARLFIFLFISRSPIVNQNRCMYFKQSKWPSPRVLRSNQRWAV